MLQCKDLTEYGHRISQSNNVESAKQVFIEMVEAFDFKSKQKLSIQKALHQPMSHAKFTQWAWDIILKSQGLADR